MNQIKQKSIQPLIDFGSRFKKWPIAEWIKLPDFYMVIYVRVSKRVIEGKQVITLDLANFEIQEDHQRKGLFTEFLEQTEKYAKNANMCVFIECVHNEHLRAFLTRKGYKDDGVIDNFCFYRGLEQ